jgi:hypothetical protein
MANRSKLLPFALVGSAHEVDALIAQHVRSHALYGHLPDPSVASE